MPIKEKATEQVVISAVEPQTIATNTTTTGAIIDTAGYDNGVYFAMGVNEYADGTFTMKLEDGDNSSLTDAADVDSDMLVYGTLPSISDDVAEGEAYVKEGVHSTKRYIRMSVVSTDVTSSGADVTGICICNPEIYPTDQDAV